MIEIDRDNIKNNLEIEYSKIQLKDLESKYIYIPLSIISDTELDTKKVGIFSYLKIRCGLDNIINFTIPDMVEWCGMKPNKREGKSNDKFLDIIDDLNDRGYLTYLTEKSRSSFMQCRFDSDYYVEECKNGYSIIYLDEIQKIMNCKRDNSKDSSLNNSTILLVFAYLRNKIFRRPNKLQPEERYPDKIEERRKRCPEAHYANINEMANELDISSKTLSRIIDVLEYDLELIATDRPYRVRNENDEFRTPPTIFANAYKRDGGHLLDTGSDYSRKEIELRAEKMKEQYKGYKIDKNKRKNK